MFSEGIKILRPTVWVLGLSLTILLSGCHSRKANKVKHSSTHSRAKRSETRSDIQKSEAPKNYSGGKIGKYEEIIGRKIDKSDYPLYYFIDAWYGTPYCYGGANLKCTDCSGFVYNAYDLVYHHKIARNAEKQYEDASDLSQSSLKQGDLVFFKINSSNISHVGLYLTNGKFVHASTSKGVRIDDLNDKYYSKYFFRGGRVKM